MSGKIDGTRIALCKRLLPALRDISSDAQHLSEIVLFVCGVKPGIILYYELSKNVPSKHIEKAKSIFRSKYFYIKVVGPYKESLVSRNYLTNIFLCNSNDSLRIKMIPRLSELLKLHDLKYDGEHHSSLGIFHGYPFCCIKKYPRGLPLGSLRSPYRNFIQHSPCEEDCPNSMKLAETYAECIRKVSPRLYGKLLRWKWEKMPSHRPAFESGV